MSHTAAIVLAKAIHSALSGDVSIQSLLGTPPRLYDHAPEDPVFPYLSYGDMRCEAIGGDDVSLEQHTLSLHIWSRYGGRAEIMHLLDAITQRLSPDVLVAIPVGVTDWLVSANIVFTDIFKAPDGQTLHGVVRFTALTQI